MMDHKSWLWKKKSTEKTIVAADKLNLSQRVNEEEDKHALIQTLTADKAELEKDLTTLNEKLSSALSECNAKDNIVEKHTKMAQEALAGWEKAEAEAMSLRQELDEVLRQRVASEERLSHLDMALKECMQQLRFVRDEQELRIHDAVTKTSREFEKARIVLEEQLADTNKRLTKLDAENTQLSKALLSKEKLIEDMNEHRTKAEADFNALMTRLNSIEKENASLKYEVRVLEKELEIRNEEREFNRRTADVAHKQHLESVKKIAKLESECQRLRILVRKRLPGPAALAKMKSEVEMLSRDPSETRRRRSSPSSTGSMDFAMENTPDTPNKRVNFLIEQLHAIEDENRNLKETLATKTNELHFSRIMYARTASRLPQVEAHSEESIKGQIAMEPARNVHVPHELYLASMSDMDSDDKVSCAESWASALISELEHFRNGKQLGTPSQKSVGASGIDLMDDFAEMEKLAIVSVDKPFGGSKNMLVGEYPSWLQDILNVVLEQNRVTQRKPDEILEDIKVALQHINHKSSSESVGGNARESSNCYNESDFSGYISQKTQDKSPLMDSANGIKDDEISTVKKSSQQNQSNLSKSICKISELIEGISLSSLNNGGSETFPGKDGSYFPYKTSETPSGYVVRVFQWKTTELTAVLQKFIQTCNDFLTGKADLENFVEELSSALDWVLNHCFSLQDVSSMRDTIKKHFDWDESRSESEVEGGTMGQLSEADKLRKLKEQLSYLPIVSSWNDHKMDIQPDVKETSEKLKDELKTMEPANKDLKGRLQTEINKNEPLMIQVQETEKTIKSSPTEFETSKELKGLIESQKMVNKDLDTQLTVASVDLDEAHQMLSSLETELEFEATRVGLQQLESSTKKETLKYNVDQEEKQLRTDWEITAASEKLAECQETILNLGRQLKALASPIDTALFDKLVSNPSDNITPITPTKSINQRSSLLDKMLAEDNAEAGDLKFPKTKEVICLSSPKKSPALLVGNSFPDFHPNGTVDAQQSFLHINGIKHNDNEAESGSFSSLAIVPAKKNGGRGLLKKLLWRSKKGNSKKLPSLLLHNSSD